MFDCLAVDILQIVNNSLQSGNFPKALKTAVIKPLLKKRSLDASNINNYRPISNLPFISKIIEKVVLQQLNHFLASTDCYGTFQSGFRPLHSTEAALIKVVNDICLNTDSGKTSILMLLDLSAAFDTVDQGYSIGGLRSGSGPKRNEIRTKTKIYIIVCIIFRAVKRLKYLIVINRINVIVNSRLITIFFSILNIP